LNGGPRVLPGLLRSDAEKSVKPHDGGIDARFGLGPPWHATEGEIRISGPALMKLAPGVFGDPGAGPRTTGASWIGGEGLRRTAGSLPPPDAPDSGLHKSCPQGSSPQVLAPAEDGATPHRGQTRDRKHTAMPIITISRGSGSGGLMLATEVAERLGYEAVSREDIVAEASGFGVSEEELREALLKPPGLWSRFSRQRNRYLAFMQATLCKRVQGGGVVYHGNAGHLLLPGVAHVICVRLIAPVAFRVKLLQERSGMDEDEARAHIEKVDREREHWTRFLYGVDWLDPTLYDLCINLRTMGLQDAVDLVLRTARSTPFQPTEESRRAMTDLVLASRVRAALAMDDRTAGAEVEIRASGSTVSLRGRLRPASLVDAVLDVVGGVDGVAQVDRSDLAAPDYTV
jgi:cytidylate kinase